MIVGSEKLICNDRFSDGVRGGFANAFSTVSKYEINPEEIKVNFADVRGVSKNILYTRKELALID